MLSCTIIETKDIEPVTYEWGAVKWVANSDLAPGWFGWIIPTGDGMVRVGIGSNNHVKPIDCYRDLTRPKAEG